MGFTNDFVDFPVTLVMDVVIVDYFIMDGIHDSYASMDDIVVDFDDSFHVGIIST